MASIDRNTQLQQWLQSKTPSPEQIEQIELPPECSSLPEETLHALRELLARVQHAHWFEPQVAPELARWMLEEHLRCLHPFAPQELTGQIHSLQTPMDYLFSHLITEERMEAIVQQATQEAIKVKPIDWEFVGTQIWQALLHEQTPTLWIPWNDARKIAETASRRAAEIVNRHASESAPRRAAESAARRAAWRAADSKVTRMTISSVESATNQLARKTAEAAADRATLSATRDANQIFARIVARKAAESAADCAADCARWIMVGHSLEQENPFLPLMWLFQMGYYAFDLINGDSLLVCPTSP